MMIRAKPTFGLGQQPPPAAPGFTWMPYVIDAVGSGTQQHAWWERNRGWEMVEAVVDHPAGSWTDSVYYMRALGADEKPWSGCWLLSAVGWSPFVDERDLETSRMLMPGISVWAPVRFAGRVPDFGQRGFRYLDVSEGHRPHAALMDAPRNEWYREPITLPALTGQKEDKVDKNLQAATIAVAKELLDEGVYAALAAEADDRAKRVRDEALATEAYELLYKKFDVDVVRVRQYLNTAPVRRERRREQSLPAVLDAWGRIPDVVKARAFPGPEIHAGIADLTWLVSVLDSETALDDWLRSQLESGDADRARDPLEDNSL